LPELLRAAVIIAHLTAPNRAKSMRPLLTIINYVKWCAAADWLFPAANPGSSAAEKILQKCYKVRWSTDVKIEV
jgi:hypothetical protein